MTENNLTQLPSNRKEAILQGSKYYFTGVPCRNGHLEKRAVKEFRCQGCNKEKAKKWRIKNPEKVKENNIKHHKIWYEKNKEYKLNYNKEWSKNNKDRHLFLQSRWLEVNIEKVRELKRTRPYRFYQNKWREKNKEKVRSYEHKRRNAEGKFNSLEIKELYKKQKGKCVNCVKSISGKYHIDHIVPISKGGTNWISNLQLLCPFCNISKGAKDPIKWAQENGRLL